MVEGTYEYECMRAELLGLEKPDHEEFLKRMEDAKRAAEEEETDINNLKDIDQATESEQRILGGLDELNTILKKTQNKINRFKVTCSSLTNLLKVKVTGRSGSESSLDNDNTSKQTEETTEVTPTETPPSTSVEDTHQNQRKSDLSKALDGNLSKLDLMIEKAEDAQYSMSHQSKQMKRFLK